MKLRLILVVLSLLAFLSTSIGGYIYYSSLKESAFNEAERQAVSRLEMIARNLSSLLSENIKPVRTLAGMSELRELLINPGNDFLNRGNIVLDHFNVTLNADVCYLMDHNGNTLASSNRREADSFVGQNFSFRPYFKRAIDGVPATYMALGTMSGKRGVYHSFPIFESGEDSPVGVVVIKISIEQIEKELNLNTDETVLVTGPRGVVFISNRNEWLYRSVSELMPQEIEEIAASRQFGKGPWSSIGLKIGDGKYTTDSSGERYLIHSIALENFTGWSVIHLRTAKDISKIVSDPLISITRPIIFALCVLVGLSVFLLYRYASKEIRKRKVVEEALRESDNRYRSLYHNTPALLHSIDTQGRLVSVSDYWVEALGYSRDEVIGKNITDFFTEDSKKYALDVVFPQFFEKGYCKDIPYKFVKKSGETIDILLSAIAVRADRGEIIRTLAVSIDVTERNRAIEALRQAKEELSLYSRDLERQVSKRTREITNILKYTPDVVYVKDRQGKYVLINSRFEELFKVSSEEVRGMTDYEIAPKEVADQFRANDLQVLETGKSIQVEERVPQKDGIHTYLSVKFPIYDESEIPSGVCGISTDITAVKKAQDQLRRLSGNIMASQEKERSAIARELHDELGQVMTALRMDSVWMMEHLREADKKAADRALTMRDLIDKTIKDIRSIAIRLRPGVLDDLGLVDALDWYTADFEKRSGISCIFEHAKIPEIDDTIATAAYRITQEALTNVARHSGAGRVEVILEIRGNNLVLNVDDDGRGFEVESLDESEGFGVAGMRERAALAGGSLLVDSVLGKGTIVRLVVPISGSGKEIS